MSADRSTRPRGALERALGDVERPESELRALYLLREHVLARLDALLAGAGLRALLVKGAAIAPLYASPHLRAMGDVDVLVAPADLEPMRTLLLDDGWLETGAVDRPLSERFLEVSLRAPPPASVVLELHTGLDKVAPREQLTLELLERSPPGPGRRALRTPTLEDQALLTVLHLANDELGHPAGFADLEVLFGAGLSWIDLAVRARQHGAATACYVALRAYAMLAPGALPPAALAAFEPGAWRRRALERLFPLDEPARAGHHRRSGWAWLLGQALLRDDRRAFALGVSRYAVSRAVERASRGGGARRPG